MALMAEYKESGDFVLAPAGLHQGVCCEVVDLGFVEKSYRNQQTGQEEKRTVHEIQYYFQLNKVAPDTGKRYEVRSKPMNLNLADKATLRDFLRQWRGHDLTDQEKLPPGVDIELIGKNAMINVIHAQVSTQNGVKTYANIGSITPIMEGLQPITPLNYEKQQDKINARKSGADGGTSFNYGANVQQGQQQQADPNAPPTSFSDLDRQNPNHPDNANVRSAF